MKHTIMTSISPRQQYEIRRWLLLSLVCFAVQIIIATCFIAPQLHTIYYLHTDISAQKATVSSQSALDTTLNKQKKEYEDLHKKYDKCMQHRNNPKNPLVYLEPIIHALNTIQIEKVTQYKKNSDITLVCAEPKDATLFIKKLYETKQYSSVVLKSLQQDTKNNKFRCFIKGIIA